MKHNFTLGARAPRVVRATERVRAHPLLAHARAQLGHAVDDMLTGSLEAIGDRLGVQGWLATHVGTRAPHAARLREILERDRALVAADASQPNLLPPSQAAIDAPQDHSRQTEQEPIRTRTMARLLAAQGHRERALRIYDELLATQDDASLRAEALTLRGAI